MKKLALLVALALTTSIALAEPASANHSWGKYHWARASNPFTLNLGKNLGQSTNSTTWSTMLTGASNDWSAATVLDTQVVNGGTDGQHCDPTRGRVEVCSYNYGNTGWLGLAQIWITIGNHIAQGVVENNDFYFISSSSYTYNNTAEMRHVMCQEVGHTLGLDHQSTSGDSLDTCMDYYHNTSSSDSKSTQPNAGDYAELRCIYDPTTAHKRLLTTVTMRQGGTYTHTCRGTGHLDSYSTVGAAGAALPGAASSTPASHESRYVVQLPNGDLLVTWITWAY